MEACFACWKAEKVQPGTIILQDLKVCKRVYSNVPQEASGLSVTTQTADIQTGGRPNKRIHTLTNNTSLCICAGES